MTFPERFIACSVCTVELAFMVNAMQCKEIVLYYMQHCNLCQPNALKGEMGAKIKGRTRSPSRCGDCPDGTPDVGNLAWGEPDGWEMFPSAVILLIPPAIRKPFFPGSTRKKTAFLFPALSARRYDTFKQIAVQEG